MEWSLDFSYPLHPSATLANVKNATVDEIHVSILCDTSGSMSETFENKHAKEQLEYILRPL